MEELRRSVKVFFLAAWVLCGVAAAAEPEVRALEQRVERLEQEKSQLLDVVRQMQERLDRLEGRAATPEAAAPVELASRVGKLEAQAAEQKDKGTLWSDRGEEIQFSGRVEMEYRDTERETDYYRQSTANPDGTFQFDKAVLQVDVKFTRDIDALLRLDMYENDARIKEAYLDWEHLPIHSRVRVGLQDVFWRPSRITEVYPLPGAAFWRSRDLGIDWRWQLDPVYGHLAVYNGLPLADHEIGEDESFPMIRDDFANVDMNNNKVLGAGLGWKQGWTDDLSTDVLVFAALGDISHEDREFLALAFPPLTLPGYTLAGYPADGDSDRLRAGINALLEWRELRLFGQYMTAEDGALERDAWYVEAAYRFQSGRKYFRSFRPLVRYGEIENDLPANPFSSLTWDRHRWTLALITEVAKNIELKAEYYWNLEDTGVGDIDFGLLPDRIPYTTYPRHDYMDNNEFLLQLRWEF